jgi:hypothetical protein
MKRVLAGLADVEPRLVRGPAGSANNIRRTLPGFLCGLRIRLIGLGCCLRLRLRKLPKLAATECTEESVGERSLLTVGTSC